MPLRFPSWDHLRTRASATARRFPLVLTAAAVATTTAILMVDDSTPERLRLVLAAMLGFSWLTALTLTAERLAWTGPLGRHVLPLAGTACLLGFVVVSAGAEEDQILLRFLHWALIGHLAAAVLPYLYRGRGFWQFNRILFQRALLAAVYTFVLFAGLALALAAIDNLLGVPIDDETYPRLFFVMALLFNPWFLLAGIPDDFAALERLEDYPAGLRVFAQHVLLPLVAVYLVILTLYLGRVIVTGTWPRGWIGILVSGVAMTGVLGLLLLHPVRRTPAGRWVDRAAWIFFAGLVPALVMALLAVGKRIGQYGVTEPRYALAVLAGWLLLLAVFYLATRSRSIRLIPASLGLVAVLTAVGPWGMFATSRRSQTNRFRAISERYGVTPGRPFPEPARVSEEDRRELAATLRYLDRRHGPAAVAGAMGLPPDSLRAAQAGSLTQAALELLGIEDPGGVIGSPARAFTLDRSRSVDSGVPAGGRGRLYLSHDLFRDAPVRLIYAGDTLALSSEGTDLLVRRRDSLLGSVSMGPAMSRATAESRESPSMAAEPVVVTTTLGDLRFTVYLTEAYWSGELSSRAVRAAVASILIDRQP